VCVGKENRGKYQQTHVKHSCTQTTTQKAEIVQIDQTPSWSACVYVQARIDLTQLEHRVERSGECLSDGGGEGASESSTVRICMEVG